MGNGKSLGFARDKWGLGQGRNSEIGEDGIRYTREKIARGYQVVKYFTGNGKNRGLDGNSGDWKLEIRTRNLNSERRKDGRTFG